MKSPHQLLWFLVAGSLGFCVDTGVLYLLKNAIGLYEARLVSFLCAVFSTWLINRTMTFQGSKSGLTVRKEFLVYLLLMVIGGGFNYGTYAFLVHTYRQIAEYPVLAVAAGSIAGMTINLLTSKYLLFRFHR